MASSRQYLDFIMDQLSSLGEVSYRAMMGEYILYCQGKVVGGIYDNRLLVKQTASAKEMLPDAPLEFPYDGAKEMILVEEAENSDLLCELFFRIASELPEPKKSRMTK